MNIKRNDYFLFTYFIIKIRPIIHFGKSNKTFLIIVHSTNGYTFEFDNLSTVFYFLPKD